MVEIVEIIEKLEGKILAYLPKVLFAGIVLIISYLAAKKLKKISLKFYTRILKNKPDIAKVIANTIYFAVLLFGGFVVLDILELDSALSKLIAGAGIVGVVFGLAFKEIASNALAGLFISVQRPFKIGDWVMIEGSYGKIVCIGIMTTSIKTTEGQEVFIPNHLIYQNSFTNFSSYRKRRVILQSGVSYGDDLEHVKKVALDEIRKIPAVLKEEDIDFYFTDIGSSSYNFEARFFIEFKEQKDYMKAKSDLVMHLKKRFEEEDISLAYAVTTLDFGVKGGINLFDHPIEIKKIN